MDQREDRWEFSTVWRKEENGVFSAKTNKFVQTIKGIFWQKLPAVDAC